MTLPAPVRRNLLLLVVCLAQLMVVLDVSIVNVALPSIRHDLGYSTTGLQWVVNAYTLTFAGFLMLGGRAADLLGRRRVFLAGTGLFTLASILCAVADSQATLDGARALQGFGAAIISPATLAILATSFTEGRARNRALAAWGAMGGVGGAAGVLLGGLLTQELSWPAIFLINVPIGLVVIAAGLRVVPEGRAELEHRHFDVAGAILITLGLTALVYGIVRTDSLGWGATGVLVPIAISIVLLAAFAFVEARVAKAPLMPARLVKLGQSARGQPRDPPALRRGLCHVVLRLAVPAAGARPRRARDRPGLPAHDAGHHRRHDADAEAHRPLRLRPRARRRACSSRAPAWRSSPTSTRAAATWPTSCPPAW